MISLFFYGVDIGCILRLIDSRIIFLSCLVNEGFVETSYADRFCFLSERIESIDLKIDFEYSIDNMFTINVSDHLKEAIKNIQLKVDEIKNNIKRNNLNSSTLTSSYTKIIRNQEIRSDSVNEMTSLLTHARLNRQRLTHSFSVPNSDCYERKYNHIELDPSIP
jgi:hypothetical protein